MSTITVKAASTLNARAEDVYTTIADYRNGHPHIVPKEHFSDIIVEEGGYGAGTTMRFSVTVLGVTQQFYHRVSEPEPGRVLVEQDIEEPAKTITTFTVDPVDNGQKAHVEIKTTMKPSPGLAGLVERLLIPLINPPMYRKELQLLEQVAQKRG